MNQTQDLVRFGLFELNVTTEELRKSGTLIRLAPQPLKLLAMLARRSGQVVTREEIQQSLWGNETYVDFEQGMNHCIKQIRTALCDSADSPVYIETVPRRGYRFLAPVVTKRIPVPPPQVRESQSGIQGQVALPGTAPPYTPPPPAKAVVLDPPVSAQPAAGAPLPGPGAMAAASSAHGRMTWIVLTAVIVLLVAIAGFFLLRSHKSALLVPARNAVVVAELGMSRAPVPDLRHRRRSISELEGGGPHSHPLARAIRAASTRFAAPSLLIASDK